MTMTTNQRDKYIATMIDPYDTWRQYEYGWAFAAAILGAWCDRHEDEEAPAYWDDLVAYWERQQAGEV